MESDGTSYFAHDRALLKRLVEGQNNPLSVQDHFKYFVKLAEDRLPVAMREQNDELRIQLLMMIREAKTAQEHFEAGEIERGLIATGWMHEHRAKCGLPYELSKAQGERGGGKAGWRGSLYKMLECWLLDLGLTELDQIYRHWIKAAASKKITSKAGQTWEYKSKQIRWREGLDSEHKPRDFEYSYTDKGNWKKTTVDNIKITFGRVCDEANLG